MEQTLFTLQVYTENIAGILNQITAVFTRRQINIESLNVSPSSIKGIHKYTITAYSIKNIKDDPRNAIMLVGCATLTPSVTLKHVLRRLTRLSA